MKTLDRVFYSAKENVILDYVKSDNTGAYSGKDLTHYRTHGYPDVEILDTLEAIKLYSSNYITQAKVITSKRFNELFGAVPPMKTFTFCNMYGFILGELITFDISIYCIHNIETDEYFEFQDRISLSNSEIMEKINSREPVQ